MSAAPILIKEYRDKRMSEDKANYSATNQESGSYFVQIRNEFFLDPDYSSDAKVLYAILLGYQGQKEVSWPGQDTLCKAMNIKSDHTLRNAIKELEDGGILTVKRRGQQMSNIYEVKKSVASIKAETPEPQNMHISVEPEPQNLPPNYIHENYINLNINKEEGEEIPAPPKKEKTVKAKKPKEPENEALTIYREETNLNLNSTLRAEVAAKITDITLWRDVVRRWCGKYNPKNIRGMIEVYEHEGKFFYERGNGLGSPGNGTGSKGTTGKTTWNKSGPYTEGSALDW